VTRSIARQTICRSSPPARWQSRGFSRGNQLVFVEKRSLRVSATYPFRHQWSSRFLLHVSTLGGRASTNSFLKIRINVRREY